MAWHQANHIFTYPAFLSLISVQFGHASKIKLKWYFMSIYCNPAAQPTIEIIFLMDDGYLLHFHWIRFFCQIGRCFQLRLVIKWQKDTLTFRNLHVLWVSMKLKLKAFISLFLAYYFSFIHSFWKVIYFHLPAGNVYIKRMR